LRSLLLLIALVAVVLAIGVELRSRALARRDAILAVDRLHGTYGIKILGPAWYRRGMGWLGVEEMAFYDPSRVSLGPGNMGFDPRHPVSDDDLAALSKHIEQFPRLELLDLRGCRRVTDRGLAALPAMPSLKLIRLGGTGVTDEGVGAFHRRHPGAEIRRSGP
jgi:hypothetical protein